MKIKPASVRPVIKIERTSADKVLEAVGIWGIIWMVFLTAQYWPKLPAIIPTHFGASGEVNGWGGKETLFMLPILSTFMYFLMAILSKYPHIYNYLYPITQANAAVQYRMAVTMINYLRTYVVLLFAYIQYNIILNALGRANGLGNWFLPVSLLSCFVPIIFCVIASRRAA